MSNSLFFRHLLWLFIFYFLEVTVSARLGSFAPPLVLCVVVGIALECGPAHGIVWGILAGILFEPFASGAIGGASLAFALAGWLTGMISSKMFNESFWVRMIWPCAALIVSATAETLWSRPAEMDYPFWAALSSALPFQKILSTLLVAPWVVSFAKVHRTSNRRFRAVYS